MVQGHGREPLHPSNALRIGHTLGLFSRAEEAAAGTKVWASQTLHAGHVPPSARPQPLHAALNRWWAPVGAIRPWFHEQRWSLLQPLKNAIIANELPLANLYIHE